MLELSYDGPTTIHNMRVITHFYHQSYALLIVVAFLSSLSGFAQATAESFFRDFSNDGLYAAIPASTPYAYDNAGVGAIATTAYPDPCVPPTVTFTASSSALCQGQAVTLSTIASPNGTYSYSISAPSGVTLSSTNSATATATGMTVGLTTFTVAVGSDPTCFTTATVSVRVSAAPVLAPVSVSLCASVGTPVNLSTILTNNESATALAGLTNTFVGANGPVSNPSYVPLIAGVNSFSVSSTGVSGCTASTPLTVYLTPAPTLKVQITSIACNTATNQYTVSGTVSLTTAQANVLTVTDGSVSTTLAVDNSTTSVPFTLPAQASGTNNHAVVASLPSCTTANVTSNAPYTAPTSCTVGSAQLILTKLVSRSVASVSTVLTYSVVVSNVGSAPATNVVLTDSSSVGLRYVANSAVIPQSSTFTQGTPVSTWTIGTIAAGQSFTLTFQAVADSAGILYGKARIPGAVATVCTSIPYRVCVGDSYQFTLTAPAGRNSYRWYRTYGGVTTELTSFTNNTLDVTTAGSYSLAVDNVSGSCPDFTCCSFVVIEDPFPTFSAKTVPATCTGATAQANGQLVLSSFQAGNTYQYSSGATFNAAASLSGAAQVIPANGLLATTLVNPASPQTYTVRVYNATGCYTDMTVTLTTTTCNCPPEICVPFVFRQTKRVVRIGDRR